MPNHPRRNKCVAVVASGRYRKETTTIKAARKSTKQGQEYLDITPRQIKAASDKCCYSGTDYVDLARVDGYSHWQPTGDKGFVSYKIEAP